MVTVIEHLIGKGYDLRLYDRNVKLAALTGANRDYILNHIPHISRLMVDSVEAVVHHAQTLVIGNGAAEFRPVLDALRPDQTVVDFVRIAERTSGGDYDGICRQQRLARCGARVGRLIRPAARPAGHLPRRMARSAAASSPARPARSGALQRAAQTGVLQSQRRETQPPIGCSLPRMSASSNGASQLIRSAVRSPCACSPSSRLATAIASPIWMSSIAS